MNVLYPKRAELGLEQLQKFSGLLSEQPAGRRIFENPTISADRRKALLKEIGNALVFDPTIRNFLNLLIERNRIALMDQIVTTYQTLLDDKLGVIRARVT